MTNLDVHYWWQWVIVGGMLITALGIIWRKIVKPLIRIEQLHPVVMEMASEFKSNCGSSLRDQIDELTKTGAKQQALIERMDRRLEATQELSEGAQAIAKSAQEEMQKGRERARDFETRTDEQFSYIHSRIHDLLNGMQAVMFAVGLKPEPWMPYEPPGEAK